MWRSTTKRKHKTAQMQGMGNVCSMCVCGFGLRSWPTAISAGSVTRMAQSLDSIESIEWSWSAKTDMKGPRRRTTIMRDSGGKGNDGDLAPSTQRGATNRPFKSPGRCTGNRRHIPAVVVRVPHPRLRLSRAGLDVGYGQGVTHPTAHMSFGQQKTADSAAGMARMAHPRHRGLTVSLTRLELICLPSPPRSSPSLFSRSLPACAFRRSVPPRILCLHVATFLAIVLLLPSPLVLPSTLPSTIMVVYVAIFLASVLPFPSPSCCLQPQPSTFEFLHDSIFLAIMVPFPTASFCHLLAFTMPSLLGSTYSAFPSSFVE